jgi:hypothetical protein
MAVTGINIVELRQLINTNKRIAEAILGSTKGVEVVESIAIELAAGSEEIGKVEISDGTEQASVNASNQLETAEANSAAIKTAVEIIDNPVSGSEMLIAGGATQSNDVKVTHDGEVVDVDATGQGDVPITLDGENITVDNVGSVVDSNNSTTSTLGGAGVYTGTGTDLLGYSAVCVTLYADVDSAADGMTFQFSSDNSNWDDVYTFTMDVSSSDTRRFQFPVTARYFRIVYTNGGGAQSAFRVQTILHTANQLTSIHRLVDDMAQDRSAQVIKAVLFGKGQGGSPDFKPIDVTNGGNLKVSVEEFNGKIPTTTFATNGASALTVIAASASNKHRIFRLTITVDTAGTATISDGFGAVYLAANGTVTLDFNPVGHLQTTANTAITITNSGGGNVSAHGTYSTEAA